MVEQNISKVYLMGIAGIAMGTLAAMFREKGYQVFGSDQNIYPPMSTHLDSLGVPVFLGYNPENIRSVSPHLVIIGNVIRKNNPEAQYAFDSGIRCLSMPEAIFEFFIKDSRSIVVAGTHGKSTTSSLLTWVLSRSGLNPSAFIGAFMNNWGLSYLLGEGKVIVLEGDEYDTAFFDKVPKFVHYRPHIGVIGSIEYDHADIYPSFEAVLHAFERFVDLIPPDGTLVINEDDFHCVELSRKCRGQVVSYGRSQHADWRLLNVDYLPGRVAIHYRNPLVQAGEILLSNLPGLHNAYNVLAVLAASATVGVSPVSVQNALTTFRGVKRRQDIVGEHNGILIVDDFAHHPTAVQQTITALRLFFPKRRLIAAFEPRSNSSRRSVFQNAYSEAFDGADCICVKEPPGMDAIPESERLDARQLVDRIKEKNQEAHFFAGTNELLHFLATFCAPGDLVLSMSNGSFDGLPQRLLEILRNGTCGIPDGTDPVTSPPD